MQWYEIILLILGGGFLGTLINRIIDIFWLSSVQEKRDYDKWLRDMRFKYFSAVAEDLTTFNLNKKGKDYEIAGDNLSNLSKIILLVDDDKLINKIEGFIFKINNGKKDIDYDKLLRESKSIIKSLRDYIISDR